MSYRLKKVVSSEFSLKSAYYISEISSLQLSHKNITYEIPDPATFSEELSCYKERLLLLQPRLAVKAKCGVSCSAFHAQCLCSQIAQPPDWQEVTLYPRTAACSPHSPLWSMSKYFGVLHLTSCSPSHDVMPKICCYLIVYVVLLLHFCFKMFPTYFLSIRKSENQQSYIHTTPLPLPPFAIPVLITPFPQNRPIHSDTPRHLFKKHFPDLSSRVIFWRGICNNDS